MSYGERNQATHKEEGVRRGDRHFIRGKEKQFMGEGRWAVLFGLGPLSGCGLGKGCQTLSTHEKDSYGTSPFYVACKGE